MHHAWPTPSDCYVCTTEQAVRGAACLVVSDEGAGPLLHILLLARRRRQHVLLAARPFPAFTPPAHVSRHMTPGTAMERSQSVKINRNTRRAPSETPLLLGQHANVPTSPTFLDCRMPVALASYRTKGGDAET